MQDNEFGKLLREYRLLAGLTQTSLAKIVGLHSSYISRLEQGQRDVPSRGTIIKFIQALGIQTQNANQLLLSAGYSPVEKDSLNIIDPALRLITDLFQDKRVTDTELSILKEYARLLDQLRKQR